MIGNPSNKTIRNAKKALESLDLNYEDRDGTIVLSAMGDDLPIGMVIMADDGNMTLNIYCYLMFDFDSDARVKLIPELKTR